MVFPTNPVPASTSHLRQLSGRSQVLALDEAEQAEQRRLRPLSFGLRFDEAFSLDPVASVDLPLARLPDSPAFAPGDFGAFVGFDDHGATSLPRGRDAAPWQPPIDAGLSLGVAPAQLGPSFAPAPLRAAGVTGVPSDDVTGILGHVGSGRLADAHLARFSAQPVAHARGGGFAGEDPLTLYTHLPIEPGHHRDLAADLAALELYGTPVRPQASPFGPSVGRTVAPELLRTQVQRPAMASPQGQRSTSGLMADVITSRSARSNDDALPMFDREVVCVEASGTPSPAGTPRGGPANSPASAHRVHLASPPASVVGVAPGTGVAAAPRAAGAGAATRATAPTPAFAEASVGPNVAELSGLCIYQPPTRPAAVAPLVLADASAAVHPSAWSGRSGEDGVAAPPHGLQPITPLDFYVGPAATSATAQAWTHAGPSGGGDRVPPRGAPSLAPTARIEASVSPYGAYLSPPTVALPGPDAPPSEPASPASPCPATPALSNAPSTPSQASPGRLPGPTTPPVQGVPYRQPPQFSVPLASPPEAQAATPPWAYRTSPVSQPATPQYARFDVAGVAPSPSRARRGTTLPTRSPRGTDRAGAAAQGRLPPGVPLRGATTPLARPFAPNLAGARGVEFDAATLRLPASPGPVAAPWPLVSTPPVYVTPADRALPLLSPAVDGVALCPPNANFAAFGPPATAPHTPAVSAATSVFWAPASPGHLGAPAPHAPLDNYPWATPPALQSGSQTSPQGHAYPTTPSPLAADASPVRSYSHVRQRHGQASPLLGPGPHLAGPAHASPARLDAGRPPASPSKRRRTTRAGDASPGAERSWLTPPPGATSSAAGSGAAPSSAAASPAGKRGRTPPPTTPDAATQRPVTHVDPTVTPVAHPARSPNVGHVLALPTSSGALLSNAPPREGTGARPVANLGSSGRPASLALPGASRHVTEAPSHGTQRRTQKKILRSALCLLPWRHVVNGGLAALVPRLPAEERRVGRAACEAWADGVDAGLQRRRAPDGTHIYLLQRPDALDSWLCQVGLPAVQAQVADASERAALASAEVDAR